MYNKATVYLTVKELLEAPALPERTLLFTEIGGLARSRPVAFFFGLSPHRHMREMSLSDDQIKNEEYET